MTDLRQQTIDVYQNTAESISTRFRGIGGRTKYVERAFELAGNPSDARVFEIGCGDGRDAKVIVDKCAWYLGMDASSEMIKLARQYVPNAIFEVGDAVDFEYPDNVHIVFAFASLLHLNPEELGVVFGKIYTALSINGIVYISTKWASSYETVLQDDQYGKRLFHLYNADIIAKLAGDRFDVVFSERVSLRSEWLEIALQKR